MVVYRHRKQLSRLSPGSSPWLFPITLTCILITTCLITAYLAGLAKGSIITRTQSHNPTLSHDGRCTNPPTRREWRTLTTREQRIYINAALRLQIKPSILTGNGTLNDDLVHIHQLIGSTSHKSASFLPWHRAFLHVYETILKTHCEYPRDMTLPYWNWELDWSSLATSSIFSDETGFGGDGNESYPLGPGDGRCVTTGPFAYSKRLWFEGKVKPHCMGRRFVYFGTNEGNAINGSWYAPEVMGRVRRAPDYQTFREMLEGTVHNGLHWSIRGDFASFSAANDPIFWLHHGQLDRLWWEWQARDMEVRSTEYWGVPVETDWPGATTWLLEDDMTFGDLWGNITVSEVMRTDEGILCYRY